MRCKRLRAKAKAQGSLETTKEQTIIVETAPATQVEVIRIEPANPQVVYVPSYNPAVVYGAWPYPRVPAGSLLSAGLCMDGRSRRIRLGRCLRRGLGLRLGQLQLGRR